MDSTGMSVQTLSLLAWERSIRTRAQERTGQSAQVRREEELIRRAQEFDQEALG